MKNKKVKMNKETKELINSHKKQKEKAPKLPAWCYVDDNGNIKVNIGSLGELIQKERNYLFIINKDKETLYEYNYKLGYWLPISKGSISKAIHDKLTSVGKWTSQNQRKTYEFINSGIPRKQFQDTIGHSPEMAFNFLNGVYNWSTGKLEPHNKKYYFEGCTSYPLDMANNQTSETNKYFKLLLGENAKTMMEFIGYSFYPSYEPIQCIVILKNEGGDGKTWFTNHVINKMLGINNVSNISLNQLADVKNNKFKPAELFHKYVNVSSELSESESSLLPTDSLKKLSGNDYINVDNKGQRDTRFQNYAKLLIITNTLVHFRDDSDGFSRRVYIMPAHKIPDFENTIDVRKMEAERGAFAYKCIELAKDAMKRKPVKGKRYLTKTNSISRLVNNWMLDNDPVQQFINDCVTKAQGKREKALDVIQAWKNWCSDNDYKPLGKTNFKNKMIKKGFNYHEERKRGSDGKQLPRKYYFTNMTLNENANPEGKINPVTNNYDFNK
ncbi:phage/plasmid primase, P4 family [Lactobacillus gasseri]|jgi:poxvirus D5 protein-like|nr:phage/plasmid primase, P4 family [Lactobacillus gasseri]KXA27038.1 nucleoside triphosphatase, D5 family [Lactobacillus gasseri]MCT7704065.1 phage/plasmid primase, P4 family [Lactobacillus gasseri]MCZ3850903.1 phage/plasmid primase, P4 family [Lactobacillus gasseri]MCZ3852690.1 phage/plasmid primase, P4 family [Lactobacillus gasseri]MCZ3861327.1 phage/plasmid primase, P4 family [Lactobacillus gasseri]